MTDLVHSSFRLAPFQAQFAVIAIRLPCREIMAVNYVSGPSPESAEILVSWVPSDERVSVYERIRQWEEKLNEFKVSCLSLAFEDGIQGMQMCGGSQQPVDIVVDACLCSSTGKHFKSYRNTLKLFEKVPQAIFGQIDCPPGGEVDVLIIGDSPTALVECPDEPRFRKVLSAGDSSLKTRRRESEKYIAR